jgi:hypothetical protein
MENTSALELIQDALQKLGIEVSRFHCATLNNFCVEGLAEVHHQRICQSASNVRWFWFVNYGSC